MKRALATIVEDICRSYGNDRTRMMDIVIAIQQRLGCVSTESMEIIARRRQFPPRRSRKCRNLLLVSFCQTQGKVIIRLCNDIVDWMKGMRRLPTRWPRNWASRWVRQPMTEPLR